MIPDEIKKCDGIHMTPCCKRFTLILSSKKDIIEKATVLRSLTRGYTSNETEKKCLSIYMSILQII